MKSRQKTYAWVAVCAAVVAASSACRESDERAANSSGGCAFTVVVYDGHSYRSTAAKVAPVPGDSLARVRATSCRDTPDAAAEPGQEVELVAIAGVPPEVAVMRRDERSIVFVRDDVDVASLPPALARLLEPASLTRPTSRSSFDPWQGIVAPTPSSTLGAR